jgi:DNA-binding response OmpR family regulator
MLRRTNSIWFCACSDNLHVMNATSTLQILVIDDEPLVRDLLGELLRFMGHRVETAACGSDGLMLFARGGYDAVVTDLVMPGLSGWDVVDGVRDIDPEATVIMVSGGATAGDVARARNSRVRLLHKPVRFEELQAAIPGGDGSAGSA